MRDEELEALARVSDEQSFIAFIRQLADEGLTCEANGGHGDWEHGTIGRYLDAVAARGESSAGYDHDALSADEPSWRRAARILLYGKYYE